MCPSAGIAAALTAALSGELSGCDYDFFLGQGLLL